MRRALAQITRPSAELYARPETSQTVPIPPNDSGERSRAVRLVNLGPAVAFVQVGLEDVKANLVGAPVTIYEALELNVAGHTHIAAATFPARGRGDLVITPLDNQ